MIINNEIFKKNTKRQSKKCIKKSKKYRCVKLTRRNKKYKGGAAVPNSSGVGLPMVIDKNNIAYSCTPVPT